MFLGIYLDVIQVGINSFSMFSSNIFITSF